jgi:type I restriction enzyme M protein
VPDREISEGAFNLDLRNPRAGDELAHRPPVDLIADLISIEHSVLAILTDIQAELKADQA